MLQRRAKRLACGALGIVAVAAGMTVLVTRSFAARERNRINGLPFDLSVFAIDFDRYAEAYDASQFTVFSPPELVAQIVFRPAAELTTGFLSTAETLPTNLRAISLGPDVLGTTFANGAAANDGAATRGPIRLDAPVTASTAVFQGSPGMSLLGDGGSFAIGSAGASAAVLDQNKPVPRTFTIEDGGRLSHSTSAATAIGVLTQEAAAVAAPESVPEPGSLVLLLTGIGGLLLRRSFAV
jgi:hypothetical protein